MGVVGCAAREGGSRVSLVRGDRATQRPDRVPSRPEVRRRVERALQRRYSHGLRHLRWPACDHAEWVKEGAQQEG
jgi:hypothetical protein